MAPGIFLIARDFNFHVDCHSDNNVKNFAEVLQTYGLQQHIQVPTHESGNTLDFIIPRSNSNITDLLLGQLWRYQMTFFIECNLNIPRPNSTVNEIFYRKLKTLDFHALKTDIPESLLCSSSWKDVSELA